MQNSGVSLSRNPVSWIWSDLMSGCGAQSGQQHLGTENTRIRWGLGWWWRRTWRTPSIKLKMSSMTTSSSFPRISVTRLAIHLSPFQPQVSQIQSSPPSSALREGRNALLHNLHIDFLHVHLLVELGWELGGLEQLRIDAGHRGRHLFLVSSRWLAGWMRVDGEKSKEKRKRSSERGRVDEGCRARWWLRSANKPGNQFWGCRSGMPG